MRRTGTSQPRTAVTLCGDGPASNDLTGEMLETPDEGAIAECRAAAVAIPENAARGTEQDNFGLLGGRSYRAEMLGLIGEIARRRLDDV